MKVDLNSCLTIQKNKVYKMLTQDDIEVFILTYNRSNLLKQSVESILNQTIGKIKITVIDNASTDDTSLIISEMQKTHANLYYVKQPKHLDYFAQNIKTAQNLAQKKYVMFFHDDDIAHPQYLEIAMSLINKYKNVDLICTLLKEFSNENELSFRNFNNIRYVVFPDKMSFTSYIYASMFINHKSLCFPNIIYKTENIKNVIMDYNIGGKASDKPFVISTLQDGICIQIREPEIFNYRIHGGQDSKSTKIDPNLSQIIEHQLFFKKQLYKDKRYKIWFDAFSFDWIKLFYSWGNNNSSKYEEKCFYQKAVKAGVLNKRFFYCKYGLWKGIYKYLEKKTKFKIKKQIENIEVLNWNMKENNDGKNMEANL